MDNYAASRLTRSGGAGDACKVLIDKLLVRRQLTRPRKQSLRQRQGQPVLKHCPVHELLTRCSSLDARLQHIKLHAFMRRYLSQ